ncbi:MAG: glycine--tRNA ligase [Acidimicrobiia bacterium]|nr:glycine--tRNA ligase [Acidimicrobiia bacterium]
MAERNGTSAFDLDTIVNLCKRRGFVFPSSEIYGGLGSTWDYGPYGVELKRNVKEQWWRSMVQLRDDVVGIDAAILMHPRVWEASGHLATFTDPLVDCKVCKRRFRADQLDDRDCPNNRKGCDFTPARDFNLMFKTFLGPLEDDSSVVYLRPETAQGIFVNFANVQTTSRKKLPFGIAQVGKSFRNEITPGRFVFRTREFEQMEMEFFCAPEEADRWYAYWREERRAWYERLGMRGERLRMRDHDPEELSHYSSKTVDVEYDFPWGWGELEGIAHRGDFDLTQHSEFSGKDLSYFDPAQERRFLPHVIEPAAGADRTAMAFLLDAYDEEEVRGDKRVVLHLHPLLAPVKCAVLPLSRNPDLVPSARKLADSLRQIAMIDYDDAGSIGKRYRRQDELGTPFCVTVDFDTLEDDAVTIRDRDSMAQERIPIADVGAEVLRRITQV